VEGNFWAHVIFAWRLLLLGLCVRSELVDLDEMWYTDNESNSIVQCSFSSDFLFWLLK